MPIEKINGMVIDFSGFSLFNFLRKEIIHVSSYRNLDRVRECLKNKVPVRVEFDRFDQSFKSRMVPFIQGMSSYFGASAQVTA
jgi:hypothetical protein